MWTHLVTKVTNIFSHFLFGKWNPAWRYVPRWAWSKFQRICLPFLSLLASEPLSQCQLGQPKWKHSFRPGAPPPTSGRICFPMNKYVALKTKGWMVGNGSGRVLDRWTHPRHHLRTCTFWNNAPNRVDYVWHTLNSFRSEVFLASAMSICKSKGTPNCQLARDTFTTPKLSRHKHCNLTVSSKSLSSSKPEISGWKWALESCGQCIGLARS